jgi:hypothetical protein
MRPDTGQNSKNRDFVIQREFNIMTQKAMILLQFKNQAAYLMGALENVGNLKNSSFNIFY